MGVFSGCSEGCVDSHGCVLRVFKDSHMQLCQVKDQDWKLEFEDQEEVTHELQIYVADNLVRDYEWTIDKLMNTCDYVSTGCGIAILGTSFVSGILGIINVHPIVSTVAAGATLSIGLMERFKSHADNQYKEALKKLSSTYKKSGLDTHGIYDTPSEEDLHKKTRAIKRQPRAPPSSPTSSIAASSQVNSI
eukprot:Em0612g4a